MKTAFITGASSGIGLELARELSRRGYRVALSARRMPLLEEAVKELSSSSAEAIAIECDVTDATAVKNAVSDAENRLGPITLAIANAGIALPTRASQFNLANAEAVMRTNFNGMLHLYDAVIPRMIERREGRFAAVASLAGLRGLPASAIYSASKAAMQIFLEAVRIELASEGIGVTTINPGFVATPLTEKNRFRMPFLMTAGKAARIIADGLERGAREIEFPFPTATAMRLARLLPNAVYDRMTARSTNRNIDWSKARR